MKGQLDRTDKTFVGILVSAFLIGPLIIIMVLVAFDSGSGGTSRVDRSPETVTRCVSDPTSPTGGRCTEVDRDAERDAWREAARRIGNG